MASLRYVQHAGVITLSGSWAKKLKMIGVQAAMAIGLTVVSAAGALAQPAGQVVTIVVPYAAGGEPDRVARIMADELQERWHQPVIVVNKEGASGSLGIRDVVQARPDGTSLLVVGPSYTMNPSLMNDPSYDPVTSLAPVAMCCSGAFTLAVHPSVPAHSLKEFVAYVQSHPGELNYASPGIGTPFHMAMELLADGAKLQLTHIPYKGYGGALTDLIGGHVGAMFLPLIQGVSLAKAGKVRLLAMTDAVRSQLAPDVPTFAEQGYGNVDVRIWIGLLAPVATPRDIVVRINADVADILRSPQGASRLAKQDLHPMAGTPESFAAFIAKDATKWRRLIAERHIQKH